MTSQRAGCWKAEGKEEEEEQEEEEKENAEAVGAEGNETIGWIPRRQAAVSGPRSVSTR
jgi:hypothetical protein